MAILTLNDTPAPIDNHAFKTQGELQTSTIFDKELSNTKIKYQVDGLRWTVDYFNQILNVNTQPLAPDINIPGTTLKYNRVDKLDIFVDSGLPNGLATDITGTGVINAGFVPYLGDAFTATVAGGRIAIFVLTAVNKEYYNTHDLYSVTFKLTYFLDTSGAMYNDLVYKTVRTYVYDKDAVDSFSAPVLLAKDYKRRIDLVKQPKIIMDHYLDLFYDDNTKFLKLPTVTSVYVDQLVINTIYSVFTVRDEPRLAELSRPEMLTTTTTIWDAILTRDESILNTCNTNLRFCINRVGAVASRKLLSYLGITYLVSDIASRAASLPNIKVNPLSARKVVIQPITNPDGNYIFSLDFYNQNPNINFSPFETVLLEYLRGAAPNRAIVDTLLTDYKYWSYHDQYYLLPILLVLIKTLISSSYSSL